MSVGAAVTAGQESLWHPRLLGHPVASVAAGQTQGGQDRVSVAPATYMLAALRDHAEQAYSLARLERDDSRGRPERGDPERLRKLYPPYPESIRERAAYLEKLAGLGQVDAALQPPAWLGEDQAQGMAERLAARLALRPEASLTRRPAADLITNLESEA
ncbi:MAG: hypothetical protein AB1899_09270 [Pseudomonadota bacterium]